MARTFTIVTRTSPLALWQAEFIKQQLISIYPELSIQIKGIKTLGDRWLSSPLYEIGGKGLFVKELEQALLDNEADLAVHSLKDMPVDLPSGLVLGAICEREDPRDAWICPTGAHYLDLAGNSVVGTSSLRRQVQLAAKRSDFQFTSLRGNVGTRLEKCLAGEYDAIVLAVAGLKRLNAEHCITAIFPETDMVPAVTQGALGIECRSDDSQLLALLAPLHHLPTAHCAVAERAMNRALGGHCHVPIAGYARWEGNRLTLIGRVGDVSTNQLIESKITHDEACPEKLGEQVAEQLIAQGALEFIKRAPGS